MLVFWDFWFQEKFGQKTPEIDFRKVVREVTVFKLALSAGFASEKNVIT